VLQPDRAEIMRRHDEAAMAAGGFCLPGAAMASLLLQS
jgi:hypothetical protein